eukprot:GILI01013808.1.p1 GENE.GILI01013808.1~~GILI01013808.1.p1  ORF type:complete len:174 (+),score=21.21 GILI01013808.1:40-522(+)
MDITNKPVQLGQWTTNLCDCCDDPTSCLEMVFCGRCQVSAQYGMLTQGRVGVEPMCCLIMFYRSSIRRRYNIDGSDLEDCCLSFFCFQLAGSQHYREMSYRGIWPGGVCVTYPIGAPQVQPMMGQQQYGSAFVVGQPVYQQYPQQDQQQGYQQKEQPKQI